MIDFTTKQLSWIVISACGIGGGGYVTMNQKIDDLDKKVAVANNNIMYAQKSMDKLEIQLSRIEEKIDARNVRR